MKNEIVLRKMEKGYEILVLIQRISFCNHISTQLIADEEEVCDGLITSLKLRKEVNKRFKDIVSLVSDFNREKKKLNVQEIESVLYEMWSLESLPDLYVYADVLANKLVSLGKRRGMGIKQLLAHIRSLRKDNLPFRLLTKQFITRIVSHLKSPHDVIYLERGQMVKKCHS